MLVGAVTAGQCTGSRPFSARHAHHDCLSRAVGAIECRARTRTGDWRLRQRMCRPWAADRQKGKLKGPVPDWALGLTGGFSTGPNTRTSLEIKADLDDGQSVAGRQITILARMSAQDGPEVASAREGTLLARDACSKVFGTDKDIGYA
jgi:hypothetical protein